MSRVFFCTPAAERAGVNAVVPAPGVGFHARAAEGWEGWFDEDKARNAARRYGQPGFWRLKERKA